jgi:hypothetical protein
MSSLSGKDVAVRIAPFKKVESGRKQDVRPFERRLFPADFVMPPKYFLLLLARRLARGGREDVKSIK